MEMHKRVASVAPETLGDETAVDHSAGATVIEVANSGDFYEGGGSVLIDGTVYTYSAVEEGEDDDTDAPSITLDSGLVADVPAGTAVEVWNPDTGAVVVDWIVEVTDDLDGSPGVAYLSHGLIPLLSEGLPVGVGDSVTVVANDELGDWVVTDIRGRTAEVDPSYLKTGIIQADVQITVGTPGAKRVVIDGSPAIEAYDAANEQTVNIDGEANFMQGSIATAADGSRVEVGQGSAFGLPAEETRFYTGDSGELAPAKITSSVSPVDGGLGIVTISAAEWDAAVPSGDPARLQLLSDSLGNLFNTSALLSGAALQILATAGKVDLGAVGDKVYIGSSSGVKVTGDLEATMGGGSVGSGAFRTSVRDDIGRAWTSYTVTTGNVTLGTGGTATGVYLQNGKTVDFRIKVTFGTGGTLTGSPTFNLPVSAIAARTVNANALFFDSSAALASAYRAGSSFNNTVNNLHVRDDASTALSSTVPFTWASGDELVITGRYETS
jgi:hypothetical protein